MQEKPVGKSTWSGGVFFFNMTKHPISATRCRSETSEDRENRYYIYVDMHYIFRF